jgi:hypothetical protein
LMTTDGNAFGDRLLKAVWEDRLKKAGATHYKIISATVIKRRSD